MTAVGAAGPVVTLIRGNTNARGKPRCASIAPVPTTSDQAPFILTGRALPSEALTATVPSRGPAVLIPLWSEGDSAGRWVMILHRPKGGIMPARIRR